VPITIPDVVMLPVANGSVGRSSEVENLDGQQARSISPAHNVFGLQIPVDHAVWVCGGDAVE
jgi:hypothetical protein